MIHKFRNLRWLPMAAISPRHGLNTLLLMSQELRVTAKWNFIHTFTLVGSIYIWNKKSIDMRSSGVKDQNIVFIGLLPITLEVIELEPWNLRSRCWLPSLIQVGIAVWNWPMGDQQMFIICHTKGQHVVILNYLGFWIWYL